MNHQPHTMQFPESEPESSFLSKTVLAVFCAIFICFFAIYIRPNRNNYHGFESLSKPTPLGSETKVGTDQNASAYPSITPLLTFNWESAEPLVFRPFKPKYHLTMAITNLDPSELIPMDKTYLSRLSLRKQLLAKHPDVVRAVNIQHHDPRKNDEIRDAIYEWYAFVMGTYLPTRYPTMFRLLHSSKDSNDSKGTQIESLVTGLKVPIDPRELVHLFSESEDDAIAGSEVTSVESDSQSEHRRRKDGLLNLLDTLGSWIDEDFLILLPSPPSSLDQDQEPKYHLQAYATYFPSGFDTRTKLSKPLSEIHAPVPGYKQKLEKSMDRFFDKLEVGRAVLRVNWSIMTKGTGLFAAFGGLHDHSSPSDTASADTKAGEGKCEGDEEEIKVEGFDGDETYVRCERQTLHRLPKTKALVFAFHTYLYPIQDIKDEGLGEDLAVAIDGLKEGSVPGIYPYKRGPYWGEAVKAFLRA